MVVNLLNNQSIEKAEYYILENKVPVRIENTMEWGKWFLANDEDRYIAKDTVCDCHIITFFFGMITEILPKLFHITVIGGVLDGENESYSTWQEAEAGHKRMVERVKSKL
ncbi:MAG: hypothetical protein ACUZ8N_09295 [Candidatus Scalindua sp.]